MDKTREMQTWERATGCDIREVIAGALRKTGRVESAAKELGVTKQCLYRWIDALDGRLMTNVEFPADEPEPVAA